jgi:pimeloyl-ACP methyl ester carboxylesterase
VVLLHGYPQTHATWRKVAPRLAEHHTVIVPDLPGYGDSRTKEVGARWTKRRVASAIVGLLASMGHSRFAVVGRRHAGLLARRLSRSAPSEPQERAQRMGADPGGAQYRLWLRRRVSLRKAVRCDGTGAVVL